MKVLRAFFKPVGDVILFQGISSALLYAILFVCFFLLIDFLNLGIVESLVDVVTTKYIPYIGER